MKNTNWIYIIILMIFVLACKQKQSDLHENQNVAEKKTETIKIVAQDRPFGEQLEFEMEVKNALDKLEYVNPEDVEIDSLDLVLGFPVGETQFAIPLSYMSAFEVANFSANNNIVSITWCPIVGTARIFDGGNESTDSGFDFGMGLNNNNLLIVDRKTNTVWNQLSAKAVHGKLKGENLKPVPTIQSTWGFWLHKYPDTKVLINKDTTNAVFPQFVNENPHYYNWKPGDGRPTYEDFHQTETLGLGVEIGASSVYFPFEILFKKSSPIEYEIEGQVIAIHFDESGLTAWAEDGDQNMIPSAIAYNWAWSSFFPNSKIYKK